MTALHRSLVCGAVLLLTGASLLALAFTDDDGYVFDDIYEAPAPAYDDSPPPAPTQPCCNSDPIERANILLVSTMDGRIQALDVLEGGRIMWEVNLDRQPLMDGNIGLAQPISADGRSFKLVPALDGNLYMFSRDQQLLEPLPMSADALLQSSLRVGGDALAGSRSVSTAGLHPITGEVRYHCTAAKCDTKPDASATTTLIFRRVSHNVRAVDSITGHEKWNLSVGEYEASLASRSESQKRTQPGARFVFSPPDGVVKSFDSCGQLLWTKQLNSHIVNSWHIEGGDLREISLFDPTNVQTLFVETAKPRSNSNDLESHFYVGTSNSLPFIKHSPLAKKELRRLEALMLTEPPMSSRERPLLDVRNANSLAIHEGTLGRALSKYYGPSTTDHNDRQIAVQKSTEIQAIGSSCSHVPGESEFRVTGFDEPSFFGDRGWFITRPEQRSSHRRIAGMRDQCQNLAHKIRRSLSVDEFVPGYWRLVALVLFTGMSLGVGLAWYRRSLVRRLTVVSSTSSTGVDVNGTTSETSTPSSPQEPLPLTHQRPSLRESSGSLHSTNQKFLTTFEPLRIIGFGGFGIVFEAQHKMDLRKYAVKKILLENKKNEISRVLREIRTMALLEHANIVRYNHTWQEEPPSGEQKQAEDDILNALKAQFKESHPASFIESEAESRPHNASSLRSEENEGMDLPPLADEDSGSGSWLPSSYHSKSRHPSSSSSSDGNCGESETSVRPRRMVTGFHVGELSKSESVVFERASGSGGDASGSLAVSPSSSGSSGDEKPSQLVVYIQMELCQSTLAVWLAEHRQWVDRDASLMRFYLHQLLEGVAYIHLKKLIHRDIKPQNIFLQKRSNSREGKNGVPSQWIFKIGDLGLVAQKHEPSAIANGKAASGDFTRNIGTRMYMSPEQLTGKHYDQKVDVFALGLVYTEMVVPHHTTMERYKSLGELQRGRLPALLDSVPKEKRIVEWLTHVNPSERPECEEVLDSPFFRHIAEHGVIEVPPIPND